MRSATRATKPNRSHPQKPQPPQLHRPAILTKMRGKPRPLGEGWRGQRSCRECQFGVFCCCMDWRTMLMGAPPQEEAK
jgi:hypothetical protein